MKKFLNKYWKFGLTLAFGLVVFLFWRYRYPFALTYQEQFQLFLFDGDYFAERMAEPGGFARYIAEFLTQFYNGVTIGAVILAVLYMLLQRLTWRLMRTQDYYALSFLPAILLWYLMGDENVLLSFVVALLFGLMVCLGYLKVYDKLKNGYLRLVVVLLLMPLLFWLIGPMALLVAAFIMVSEIQKADSRLFGAIVGLAAILCVVACILMSAHLLPYPLLRLAIGVGYYRVPMVFHYMMIGVMLMVLLLACCARFLPKAKLLWQGLVLALIAIFAAWYIPKGYEPKKYELIEYDYLVRVKDWNAIIAKAEKQMPDLPMSVSATNLALAMTEQLGNRAFDFYQHGTEGLLPKFERNFATSQLTGEIFFHLGLINTAQRFAFEAMEAIPNYNKSARIIKRLAETNLINGQYKVAEKYLRMLEKTIFYRPWAQRTLAMLGDEKAINAHPLYGTLRQYQLQEDFLFSDREQDKICGRLFVHNQQNQVAAQYLLLMPLLDRDIPRFMSYVQLVQKRIQYNPRVCQEAIAFAFMQQRQQPPQGLVSPMILQQLNDFARIYARDKNAPELARFSSTVWYYLTVGK